MIKRLVVIGLIIGLLSTQAGLAMASEASKNVSLSPLIGQRAPDFELETINGNIVKLFDFKGEKVLLSFWTTWCPSCKEGIPALNQFYHEAERSIKVVTINIDPNIDVEKFVREKRIAFPVLLDKNGQVTKDYQIMAVPTTYFINEQGMITQRYLGALSIEKLREYTNKM